MTATLTPPARTPPGAGQAPVPQGVEGTDACVLTRHVPLKRVIMLLNPLSGSVGPAAAEEAQAILERYACETSVVGPMVDSL